MSYSKLLADRKIRREPGVKAQVGDQQAAARRDLAAARKFRPMLDLMDRMRRQRHRITYEAIETVSSTQIAEALQTAQEFVLRTEALLAPLRKPPKPTRR